MRCHSYSDFNKQTCWASNCRLIDSHIIPSLMLSFRLVETIGRRSHFCRAGGPRSWGNDLICLWGRTACGRSSFPNAADPFGRPAIFSSRPLDLDLPGLLCFVDRHSSDNSVYQALLSESAWPIALETEKGQ
jgi:hypothetical protein